MAVAAGAARLEVTRRPRVRILCTGDELRPPGARSTPGQIHNSNGPMLRALASAVPGARPRTPSTSPMTTEATAAALSAALDAADVVLVSGGVSVGPHDHVKPALERLGVAEVFWRVALQPGKPTWFGARGPTLVFGLPGNPVSTAVTFHLFARPALRAQLGAEPLPARSPGTAHRAGPSQPRSPTGAPGARCTPGSDGLWAEADRRARARTARPRCSAPTRWPSSPPARASSPPGRRSSSNPSPA